jgi:arginine N-succinyltransferase
MTSTILSASRRGRGRHDLVTQRPRAAGRADPAQRRDLAGKLPRGQQGFLFVLEDTRLARVVGVSAIEVAVGLDEPFYNFRLQRTVRASKELGVYKNQELLNLSYDHTGHSELCTLFLDPEYQKNRNGLFLEGALLFIAAFRELFSPHLFAELRGRSDEQGNSPFWDALGHHFFDIPFADADRLTGTGMKTFIAELMPAYPIYVSLLPDDAREASARCMPIPRRRGRFSRKRDSAGAVRSIFLMPARYWKLKPTPSGPSASQFIPAMQLMTERSSPLIVANNQFEQFRAVLISPDDQPQLNQAALDALAVNETDRVHAVTLHPEARTSWR